MLLRIALMLPIFCTSSVAMEAKIIETRYIEDVIPLVDEDTWLLVDLDNCMFEGAQALGHANWFYDELQQKMQKGMSREEAIRDAYPVWIETQKLCKVKPLEASFVPALITLQAKGVVVMGLTHRQSSVVDSTIQQIYSLGFDFLKTAPSKETLSLPGPTPTLYSQGVLFVGDYNKKIDVFEPFLSLLGKTPKKIVFIDDKRKNVEELERLASYGIEYIGVHYTAIEHVKPVYVREIAEFQYKIMNQIISNEAAQVLMEHGIE